MPQMSPMWWTTLFMLFIMLLMLMWVMMYSQINISPSPSEELKQIKLNNLNWMW
uniref:ATP synthase F0 subunit 8 n=1 Tax=Valentia hoffmanni TaxID=575843 RepID=C5HIY1_9HEMI|nr:ATP synthase F0 subunit 8 [Valentia hoffmanni]ACJ69576.1 ATP synthase F0 subunit 8 [Valentia hoffmanni]